MADFNSACVTKVEKNTEEEMDVDEETEKDSVSRNEEEPELKEDVKNDALEEDPFKKPDIFAAPSLSSKRATVIPGCTAKKVSHESDNSAENPKSERVLGTDDQIVGTTGPEKEDSNTNGGHPAENVGRTLDSTNRRNDEKSVNVSSKDAKKVNARVSVQPAPARKYKPGPPLPYSEPPWGGISEIPYSLEILKNGAIVDTIPLTQRSYFVIGRLPLCDVSLEHPSISRYHAVLQYRQFPGEEGIVGEDAGFYAFDLGSTHGTFVNKNKIPSKTYIRLRVGHVLKFGGSTRLFILQGPEFDEEAESELTVTELKERARKQREELERRMMGDGSDEEDEKDEKGEEASSSSGRGSSEEAGCSWGMEEDAAPEDENEENPFATEFQEDQEAAYLKDPKKALQGFFDREGEELEYEYEDKSHGTWLCRVKLPVDDAAGRQLVAEVTHTGKKKEAAIQCSLEACRILEARGLLRQEAVSRKRKKKNWEDDDFYDSDDDTFLDRTGSVEKKRKERMKRAGKIEERPETYDSLVEKLAGVEKELADTEAKLHASGKGEAHSTSEDSLDAFMSEVRSAGALDGVERRKLHVHVSELRREAQRLRRLVELTRPAQLPALRTGSQSSDPGQPRKPTLPLFGAMKGGSKFKLKTGTVGRFPPKRPELPPELFSLKELPPGGEVEEEEEEEEIQEKKSKSMSVNQDTANQQSEEAGLGRLAIDKPVEGAQRVPRPSSTTGLVSISSEGTEPGEQRAGRVEGEQAANSRDAHERGQGDGGEKTNTPTPPKSKEKKRMLGPSRPPVPLSTQYPEDDPDYCVWVPPAGQTGDGRTHLNDKYGY